MDWEKQDNELRKLMDGADFLPEEERWNAVAGWKKLQQKKQPSKKGLSGYWMQLTAAACIVGMLGFGLWWMQEDNSKTETDIFVQNKNIDNKNDINIDKIEKAQNNSSISGKVETGNITNNFSKETTSLSKEINKDNHSKIHKAYVKNPREDTIKQDDEIVLFYGNENEMNNGFNKANAVVIAPEAPSKTPDVASAVPVKKPKMKVIHYNELNGMHATSPPVFVLTKKSDIEWENLAVQNAPTQKLYPYSLKIDISPAPKKSL